MELLARFATESVALIIRQTGAKVRPTHARITSPFQERDADNPRRQGRRSRLLHGYIFDAEAVAIGP
jgi:hypothetical protein